MTATPDVCATRQQLLAAFDDLLQPARFKDYGPNGLQVEGRPAIRKLVSGVTASLALIEAAAAEGADAILVHHGLFWRGQDGRVTGWMKQRLSKLLAHDINLYAYHLPLDAHPVLGNNAQLAARLALQAESHFGDQDLGSVGRLPSPLSPEALAQRVQAALNRAVTLVSPGDLVIERVAWCTGGAQGFFEAAIAAGAQAYITGEISEPQAHHAREMGVAYLAAGHHATERYGAQALGRYVAAQLGLAHVFIDIDNPA